jgi:hypothetical protein
MQFVCNVCTIGLSVLGEMGPSAVTERKSGGGGVNPQTLVDGLRRRIRFVMSFSRQRRCIVLLLTLGTTFPLTAGKGTCGGAPVTMSSIASSLRALVFLGRPRSVDGSYTEGGGGRFSSFGVMQGPPPVDCRSRCTRPSAHFAHGETRISQGRKIALIPGCKRGGILVGVRLNAVVVMVVVMVRDVMCGARNDSGCHSTVS